MDFIELLMLSLWEPPPASHFWCLHCQRAWPREAWQQHNFWCPDILRDGSPLDAQPWEQVRRYRPDFPKVPESGAEYRLS